MHIPADAGTEPVNAQGFLQAGARHLDAVRQATDKAAGTGVKLDHTARLAELGTAQTLTLIGIGLALRDITIELSHLRSDVQGLNR